MEAQYRVDPSRVYVAGVSGGGRIASMLAVGYPDVFAGGLYFVGCSFYRDVRSRDERRIFPRDFVRPPAELFERARTHSRHVLLTGENDLNREPIRLFYEEFKRDKFASCTYLLVPGMGHATPNAEWFGKALELVDPRPAAP
jgi:pimeloyl-ACP methyl ester carboxylesterase